MLGSNKSQLQRENVISVTNFINPQRFWYLNVDEPRNTLREFQELESELQKRYAGKNVSREFVPQVGDIVAVNFISWNKVIRGRIESLAEFSNAATEYIVWALDYGFPFQSRIDHVHFMNKEFFKRIDRIRCGAIANILPAETEFDFVLVKGKMVAQKMWNRRAIESLEKLINDAASVVFIEKFQAPENGMFCGDLKIVHHHTTKEFLASQFLIEINVAIEAPNFRNIYSTLMTTKIPRWQTNNKNSTLIKNELIRGDISAVGSEQECDLLAKTKVADWCARNENFAGSRVSYVTTPTDCYDISCDDSVSVKNIKRTIQNESNHTQKSCDKGLITNRRELHRYSVQEDNSTFETSNNETKKNNSSQFGADGGLSTRTIGLRELRKRMRQQKTFEGVIVPASFDITNKPLIEYISSNEKSDSSQSQQPAGKPEIKNSKMINADSHDEKNVNSIIKLSIQNKQNPEIMDSFTYSSAEKANKRGNFSTEADSTSTLETTDDKMNLNSSAMSSENVQVPKMSVQVEQSELYRYSVQEDNSKFETSNNESTLNTVGIRRIELRKKIKQKAAENQYNNKIAKPITVDKEETKKLVLSQPSPYLTPAGHSDDSDKKHKSSQFGADGGLSTRTIGLRELRKRMRQQKTFEGVIVPASFDITNKPLIEYISSNEKSDSSQSQQPAGKPEIKNSKMVNADGHDKKNVNSMKDSKKAHLTSKHNNETNLCNIRRELCSHDTSSNSENSKHVKNTSKVQMSLPEMPIPDIADNSTEKSFLETSSLPQVYDDQLSIKPITTNQVTLIEKSQIKYTKLLNTGGKVNNKERLSSSSRIAYSPVKGIIASAQGERNSDCEAIINQSSSTTSLTSNSNGQMLSKTGTIKKNKQQQTKFLKITGKTVLAHSRLNVNPLNEIADDCLSQEVMHEMEKMKMTDLFHIQAYAWSHLVRGNSLFLISPAKSGKTWSYLPPICSLVSYRLEERQRMRHSYGPVAIILVASSLDAEIITSHCRRILCGTKRNISIVPSYAIRNEVEEKIELHNGCGILVVTPSSLLRLLNDIEVKSLIDRACVRYVIIDDMDLMLSRSRQDFEAVLKLILKTNQSPKPNVSYQLVVTSRNWNPLMAGIIRLSNHPLVCFGDYLEAAVYSKAQISIKLQSNITKITSVLDFIEQHSIEFERLLIICNSHNDLLEVVQSLTEAGHTCISYSHSSSAESLTAINEWKLLKVLCNQILVCTDVVLPKLAIQNVQNLIHYSMPASWTQFIFRFSVLSETLKNMVACDFSPKIDDDRNPNSLILLDEQNNIQLPRLIEFMKKHNQSKYIHSDIMAATKNILLKSEESRRSKGKLVCPQMLEFGDCDEFGCQYRHKLARSDRVFEGIPKSGEIRIHILQVFSPTHYAARLLELKTKGCTNWEIIRRSNEVAVFTFKLNLHYMKAEHHVKHWPLQINDLCIYKSRDNFHRCRILELPTISGVNVVRSNNVWVKLIDMGTVISCDSVHLFECADEFKNFPPQAIDIRLLGVVPFDRERHWDKKCTQAIQEWIMSNITSKECVHVSINFALMDTIWVNNVIVMEKLETIGSYIYKVNVKRSLIEEKFGILDKKPSSLRKIAEELGLVEKADEVKSSIESPTKENSMPQNQVKDKNTLITFSPLSSSEEPKQRANSRKSDSLLEPITEEVSILPENSSKSSDLLIKPKYVQKPQISDLIAEEWAELVTDKLIEVELEDCEYGNWNEFYVYRYESKYLKKYDQLENIIAEYVNNGNIRNALNIDDDRLAPMQNCLIKFDGLYCRAKIHSIFGSGSNKLYRIFLSDYGCFTQLNSADIRNDSDLILEITNEIIKFMPFQAVRCKLAGIHLDKCAQPYKVKGECLLAYVVKEYASLSGFDIQSYEILLYECTADGDLSAATMVNRTIVNLGYATYDDKTKHFLDVDLVKFDNSNEKATANFQDLLICFENSLAFLNKEEGALKSESANAVCAAPSQEPKEPLHIEEIFCESEEQNVKTVITSPPSDKLPLLKSLHKRPKTMWHETDFLICLKIYAPDVVDYYLEVTHWDVIFVAEIQNEKHVLVLNLLGSVEPKYVSHEIRGLYVTVELVKMVFMKWPRLLEQSTKFPWLSYDYDAIDTSEIDKILPLQSEHDAQRGTPNDGYNSDFSDSGDSESNLFKTFTPIANSEDVHDPSAELI